MKCVSLFVDGLKWIKQYNKNDDSFITVTNSYMYFPMWLLLDPKSTLKSKSQDNKLLAQNMPPPDTSLLPITQNTKATCLWRPGNISKCKFHHLAERKNRYMNPLRGTSSVPSHPFTERQADTLTVLAYGSIHRKPPRTSRSLSDWQARRVENTHRVFSIT